MVYRSRVGSGIVGAASPAVKDEPHARKCGQDYTSTAREVQNFYEMSESQERVCKGCGATEETVHLEACAMCQGFFCADCAHRAGFGRKYCSADCTRAYYFAGQSEDGDEEDDDYDE